MTLESFPSSRPSRNRVRNALAAATVVASLLSGNKEADAQPKAPTALPTATATPRGTSSAEAALCQADLQVCKNQVDQLKGTNDPVILRQRGVTRGDLEDILRNNPLKAPESSDLGRTVLEIGLIAAILGLIVLQVKTREKFLQTQRDLAHREAIPLGLQEEIRKRDKEIDELKTQMGLAGPATIDVGTTAAYVLTQYRRIAGIVNEALPGLQSVAGSVDAKGKRVPVLVIPRPEIESLVEVVDIELKAIYGRYSQDEKAALLPLLSNAKQMKAAFKEGRYKEAHEAALRLRGSLDLLSALSGGGEAGARTWEDYKKQADLPSEWINPNDGELIDFFAMIGVASVASWSEQFRIDANKAYRTHAQASSPDRAKDPGEKETRTRWVKMLNRAKDTLCDEATFAKYIAVYEAHKGFKSAK